MEKRIGIKGKGAGRLNGVYLESLMKVRYGLKGDFSVRYEPSQRYWGRGTVILKGNFDVSEVYSVLSKKFTLTRIDGIELENPNRSHLETMWETSK